MKVKVIKAGQDTFWYADRIGEVFTTYGHFEHNGTVQFRVNAKTDVQGSPCISSKDCHIIIDGCEFAQVND